MSRDGARTEPAGARPCREAVTACFERLVSSTQVRHRCVDCCAVVAYGEQVYRSLHWYVCLGLLGLGVASGCVSGAVDDDIEEVCEDHCHGRFECGYSDALPSEDVCVEECVPLLKADRKECVAQFELTRCQAQLTCAQLEVYSAGIDGYARTAVWPASFPCRDESMEKVRVCLADE